jgi:hypothetical protein
MISTRCIFHEYQCKQYKTLDTLKKKRLKLVLILILIDRLNRSQFKQ